MKIRTLVLAGALGVTLLVAGCATSVAGQAEVAAGAVAPASSGSGPADSSSHETAESTDSGAGPETSAASTDGGGGSSDASSVPETSPADTGDDQPSQDSSTSAPDTPASDKSVAPTSIPGLSADCNKVLAAITAFSSVLQGATSGDMDAKITQDTVDTALKQLPASGLPARPQADITILRATVSAAAGKTLAELGMTMTDGKVVGALQDLSSWATATCS